MTDGVQSLLLLSTWEAASLPFVRFVPIRSFGVEGTALFEGA